MVAFKSLFFVFAALLVVAFAQEEVREKKGIPIGYTGYGGYGLGHGLGYGLGYGHARLGGYYGSSLPVAYSGYSGYPYSSGIYGGYHGAIIH